MMTTPQLPSKSTKVTYWVTTGLVSALMLLSAFNYFFEPYFAEDFKRLGFVNDSFRIELAIAKILGVIALLIPRKFALKEWAYAGFTIDFISAFIAHISVGDSINHIMPPVVALFLLFFSYWNFKKVRDITN